MSKPATGTIAFVGAPLCDGQPLGGVNLAPDAFRKAGFETVVNRLDWKMKDYGDVQRATADSIQIT